MSSGAGVTGLTVVDCFAGPGGWDVGAVELGLDPLGIEWDDAACRVREAAGLRTLQADVAALDPEDFPCDLLIASPPCTAFSMAGKGEGRKVVDELAAAMFDLAKPEGVSWQTHGPYPLSTDDPTAHLVLEPLRWALEIRPQLVCCEQVPPVLPLWDAMADVLCSRGYSAWTGILSAEQFGVPQTRKRAFLIASGGPVNAPTATHQRYVAPRSRDDEGGGLFALPDAERIVAPGDAHLLPWVSMAEALGWQDGPAPSPAPTVTSGGAETGGVEVFASRGARARARARAAVLVNPYECRSNSAERSADEPAPTVLGGSDFEERVWEIRGQRRDSGPGAERAPRSVDDPSCTIRSAGSGSAPSGVEWVDARPSTTVAGDARVFPPGGHLANDGRDNSKMVGRSEDAVRVTIEQAACLQSFPAGYPWEAAGSRSAAFRCIGNAVPPLLARAVLAEALSSISEQATA